MLLEPLAVNFFLFLRLTSLAYYIFDLSQPAGGDDIYPFTLMIRTWAVSGFIDPAQSRVITCQNFWVLGGSGLQTSTGYMTKTYTGFGFHTMVYFGVGVFLMGTWHPGDTFSLQLDDKEPTLFTIGAPTIANFSCGDSSIGSLWTHIIGKAEHTASSITIKISWKTVTPSLGIGLRDFSISFGTKKADDVEGAYITTTQAIYPNTRCDNGHYLYGGSCLPCQSRCEECYGPSDSECYLPWFSNYYDGNQIAACEPGCQQCSGPNSNQCYQCYGSLIITLNARCADSCTSPNQPFGLPRAYMCILPCTTDHFILYNDTCVSSCDPPLLVRSQTQIQTCESPCGQTVNQHLYWDGTCQPTCPYYSRTNGGYYFCDACQPGYYMYSNKTCSSLCYPAFTQRTQGGSKFCDYPCNDALYLYQNGSCLKHLLRCV